MPKKTYILFFVSFLSYFYLLIDATMISLTRSQISNMEDANYIYKTLVKSSESILFYYGAFKPYYRPV